MTPQETLFCLGQRFSRDTLPLAVALRATDGYPDGVTPASAAAEMATVAWESIADGCRERFIAGYVAATLVGLDRPPTTRGQDTEDV